MTEEIPKSEETPEELCPDCGVRMAFAVKCFVAPDSWLCQTCFNVRWQRDHSRQAFWERAVLTILRSAPLTTDQASLLADEMLRHWNRRFGKTK